MRHYSWAPLSTWPEWEVLAALEHHNLMVAQAKEHCPDDLDMIEIWGKELADELERRSRLAYARSHEPFDLKNVTSQIHARADILAVAGRLLRTGHQGRSPWQLASRQKQVFFLCPFHTEDHPSLAVYREQNTWHCFGCLPTGHLIKTAIGVRPIETIKAGDLVVAGDGELRPVRKTFHYVYEGDLVKIRCSPFKVPIYLTPDHKVPVRRPKSQAIVDVPAGELRPQNYLLYPIAKRPVTSLSFHGISESWTKVFGPIPRGLPVTVDTALFSEWLGWYLAEGSTSGDRVIRFSLHRRELPIAERLATLTKQIFGCEMKIKVTGNKCETYTCHALLGRWLQHHCGDGAKLKRIPDFVWSWSSEDQWRLMNGLLLGDGHLSTTVPNIAGRDNMKFRQNWTWSSASPTLADDVRDLAISNGIVPLMHTYENKNDGRKSWSLRFPANIAEQWGASTATNGRIFNRIRSVERVPYKGMVHNFEVDTEHTYTTISGVVNNCREHGDVIDLVSRLEGLTFMQAVRQLAVEFDVEIPERRRAGIIQLRRRQ